MGLFKRKAAQTMVPAEPSEDKDDVVVAPEPIPAANQPPVKVSPQTEPARKATVLPPISAAQVLELAEHFPLGAVSVSMDFKSRPVQSTILLGYQLDKHRVYIGKKLRASSDSGQLELELDGSTVTVDGVSTLYLMVAIVVKSPDDEPSADTSPVAQGFPGASEIFVRCSQPERRHVEIRGIVKKRVGLKQGFHAGQHVMLIQPILETRRNLDLRQKLRITANLPAVIKFDGDEHEPLTARLADFNDDDQRLDFDEPTQAHPELEQGKILRYSVILGDAKQQSLSGVILQRRDGAAVVKLSAIMVDGQETDISPMLALGLKTKLLQAIH